jgi:ApaG protein
VRRVNPITMFSMRHREDAVFTERFRAAPGDCGLPLTTDHIAKSTSMGETRKYDVTVLSRVTYVEDQSDPSKNQYVFAYTMTVTNTGTVPAQLVSRHWIITDANSKVLEVKGLGVIGKQPLLKPGESFEYTSGTNLETAVGTMRGVYQMIAEDGQHFDAQIPPFTLSVPRVLH